VTESVYKRILLKLSGEAMAGGFGFGIAPDTLEYVREEVQSVLQLGVQIAVVIGGGNLFRGAALSAGGLNRMVGDQMGMLATVMNGLAIQDTLARAGMSVELMSGIAIEGVVPKFNHALADRHLNDGRVVIFCGGTGNPLLTTDTAACLRGIEIDADVVIKSTNVDGVYSADPAIDRAATRYSRLTYDEVLDRGLAVMDMTAILLARDHDMPIRVMAFMAAGELRRAALGEDNGTTVSAES
jgi:uridylate kinase